MELRKITRLSMFLALAVTLNIVENVIPIFQGIVPGVKLGLANIMILVILYELGILDAIIVNVLRVVVVGLVRGSIFSMGFLMSLTGAIFSLGIMILFYVLIKKFSIIGVSVIGSLFHVTGQVLIAMIFLGSAYVILYLPIIAISAIITGVFVGITAMLIIKTGAIKKQREKYNF